MRAAASGTRRRLAKGAEEIRRWQPTSMRPAGQEEPHPPSRCGDSGGRIAGEYDRGPSAGAGAHPRGDEASSGAIRSGPENTGGTTYTVSRAWLEAGHAGELETTLREVVSAHAREDEYLEVQVRVLDQERDEMHMEMIAHSGTLWQAQEDAHRQLINPDWDVETDHAAKRAWIHDVQMRTNYDERNAIEIVKYAVNWQRRTAERRGMRINALAAALAGLMKDM